MSEYIIKAVERHFQSDICDVLREQSPMEMLSAPPSIRLPMVARAEVLYNKFKPQVVVEVRAKASEASNSLGGSYIYAINADLTMKEAYAMADHAIETMRHSLAHTFIEAQKKIWEAPND